MLIVQPDGSHDNFDCEVIRASPAFDAGDYAPGDRVRYTHPDCRGNWRNAVGTVVKVDKGALLPVVVWFDWFGKPTPVERAMGFGLPTAAGELERVK